MEEKEDSFILCKKYTNVRVVKDDGTVVAVITQNDCDSTSGYTIVLTPNYEYKD